VKRLLIVAVGIAIALSVAVSSASASITATAPPSGVPTTGANYQILSPWACGGHGGVYSMSDPKPILIKFGWFAQTAGQVQQFFQNAYGSYTITNNAGEAITDSWARTGGTPPTTTQGITWSPIAPATSTPNGTTTVNGYASFYYAVLTFTQPGTYYVTTSLTFTKSVYDGFGATQKGTYTTGPCSITVNT
jgi:hypothetical protein